MSESSTRNGWSTVAFGDLVRHVRDRVDPEESGLERFVAGEHMETDDLKIRRWGLIGDGYLGPAFHMRFKPGHVLYGSRRTYLRKVAVADFEGITANTTFVLESKDSRVLMPEFLPFIMQTDSFHEHAIKQSKGSVNPYINFSDLTWYEFDLPPLDEQHRISELLSSYEAAKSQARTLERSCHNLLQSVLADVCRMTGDSIPISQVCPFITSGSRGWARYYSPSGRVFFRISNMKRECIRPDWSDRKFVNAPSDGEAARTKVSIGDVLVSVTAELGLVTLVDDTFPESHVNQHIAIIRPDRTQVSPRFLAYFLSSRIGMRQFRRLNDQGPKAGLNLVNIGSLKLPKLSLPEQEHWAGVLRKIDEASANTASRFESIAGLKRHLLGYVLKGSIDVL